jgi:hypothetical protein
VLLLNAHLLCLLLSITRSFCTDQATRSFCTD